MNKAPLFIGLAGYGTVGSGLAEVLHTNKACILRRLGREIRIKRVLEPDHGDDVGDGEAVPDRKSVV